MLVRLHQRLWAKTHSRPICTYQANSKAVTKQDVSTCSENTKGHGTMTQGQLLFILKGKGKLTQEQWICWMFRRAWANRQREISLFNIMKGMRSKFVKSNLFAVYSEGHGQVTHTQRVCRLHVRKFSCTIHNKYLVLSSPHYYDIFVFTVPHNIYWP